MAYRLDLDESPATTARAVLAERLHSASERLRDEADPADALHDARTDLKKSRALLRLLRPALGAERYGREMTALREIAHAIAGARDSDVLPLTLESLRDRYKDDFPETDYATLAVRLSGQTARADDAAALTAQLAALESAAQRIQGLQLRPLAWSDLIAELERTYRRGRRALKRAHEEPSIKHLHAWRMRVKELRYQVRLFEAAQPEVFAVYGERAKSLADLLGEDHDLAMLLGILQEPRLATGQTSAAVERAVDLAQRRRGKLEAKSWRLGWRLYAERPSAFGRRVATLVETAQQRHARSRQEERRAGQSVHRNPRQPPPPAARPRVSGLDGTRTRPSSAPHAVRHGAPRAPALALGLALAAPAVLIMIAVLIARRVPASPAHGTLRASRRPPTLQCLSPSARHRHPSSPNS